MNDDTRSCRRCEHGGQPERLADASETTTEPGWGMAPYVGH